MRRRVAALAITLLLTACIQAAAPPGKCGGAPATAAVTGTKAATTTTAASAPAVDPAVMGILQRLEAAGGKHYTADVDYLVEKLQIGYTERRDGKVYYQPAGEKTSLRFRIGFKTLRSGKGAAVRRVVDYAFDGEFLTIRKQRIKQMIRYQIALPGQRVNPLRLGKGPFPFPFGQKAADVIKHFHPSTRPAGKADPKGADYIKLVTRRAYRKSISLVWVEMWVDRKTGVPVKLVAEDQSENRTTVIFKDPQSPKSIPAKEFSLPRPGLGWEYRVERFKGKIQ